MSSNILYLDVDFREGYCDAMHDTLSIDAWLRGRRAQRDVARSVVAAELCVSERLLAAWERGDLPPAKVEHVRALARWGGLEPVEILAMIPPKAVAG